MAASARLAFAPIAGTVERFASGADLLLAGDRLGVPGIGRLKPHSSGYDFIPVA